MYLVCVGGVSTDQQTARRLMPSRVDVETRVRVGTTEKCVATRYPCPCVCYVLGLGELG